MTTSKLVRVLAFIAISSLVGVAGPVSAKGTEPKREKTEYTFAVIPQGPPEVMQKRWLPFIDRLSGDTGLVLKLKVYEKMKDFEDDLKYGRVDFAFMNPVQQTMAWNAQGYVPLVRSRNLIRGAIFVRKDSALQGIDDLKEKKIAFVGTKNVCSVVLRHELKALQITPHYVGSSSNVYKQVAIGDTAAGGTLDIAFEKNTSEVKQVLHPIYTTEPLSPHPISAHPSVAADTRQLIKKSVLKHPPDKDLQILLMNIRMQDPVSADYQIDYQSLEQILTGDTETEH